MKVLISLMLFVLSYNQTYSQVPINYVLGEKSVSKDYILKGKSLLKIKNTSKIKSLIKSDLEFTNFYTKKKDSINEWYISSLILFSIKDKHIITPNKIISDFELNNIANNFINTFFNQIKFCYMTEKEYLLGFYLTFDADKNRFTFGFVEVIDNQYYYIFEDSKSLHLKQNRQPSKQIIKPD